MSPAAELRLVGIRTQGDYGCPPAINQSVVLHYESVSSKRILAEPLPS